MIQRQHRILVGFASIGAAVAVAIAGYVGVSREIEVAFQMPYFASAGVGSLLLFGFGAALLLTAQLERDTERIQELEEAVRHLGDEVGRLLDEQGGARGSTRGKTPSVSRRSESSSRSNGARVGGRPS